MPGAVDTWSRLSSDYGKLGLDACLQPAIRYAEDGFAVAPRVAVDWAIHEEKLAQDPNTRRLYLKRGRAPKEGERFAIRELAQTLRTIDRKSTRLNSSH